MNAHDCDDGEKCEPCPRCYKERGLDDSCSYVCEHASLQSHIPQSQILQREIT